MPAPPPTPNTGKAETQGTPKRQTTITTAINKDLAHLVTAKRRNQAITHTERFLTSLRNR